MHPLWRHRPAVAGHIPRELPVVPTAPVAAGTIVAVADVGGYTAVKKRVAVLKQHFLATERVAALEQHSLAERSAELLAALEH